jgi:hypothetical protein
MTINEPFKKILEQQEALRRAVDPLADIQQKIKTVSDPLATARVALEPLTKTHLINRDLTRIGELGALSKLADIGRASRVDTLGLSTLADLQHDHLRLIAGPFADFRRKIGGFDPSLVSSSGSTFTAIAASYDRYEQLFRLPAISEASRLASETLAKLPGKYGVVAGIDARALATTMQSMQTPWLHREHALQSALAFTEIQALGRAIESPRPFDATVTSALRDALGDWRGVKAFPDTIFTNPVARSDFYVGLGFNVALTEFTAPAFDETMALAGIGPPDTEEADEEDAGLERNTAAYKELLRFELRLRRFIDRVMTEAYGARWVKQRTPPGMMKGWREKRATALTKGESEQPLINYADFSDYAQIIGRNDNWNDVFKAFFGRREDVQESLIRLSPIRIVTMHARILTLDDELLLRVETRRVLRAIENG